MKAKKAKSSCPAAKAIPPSKDDKVAIKKKPARKRVQYALLKLRLEQRDPTIRGKKGVMPGSVDPNSDLFKVSPIAPELPGLYSIPHYTVFRTPFKKENPSYPVKPVSYAELSASFGPRLPENYVPLIMDHHIAKLDALSSGDERFMLELYRKNPKLEFDVFSFLRIKRLQGALQSHSMFIQFRSNPKLILKSKCKLIRLAASLKYIDLKEFVEIKEAPFIPPGDRPFPKRHIKYCLEPKEPSNKVGFFQPIIGSLIKIVPLADGAIEQENKVGFEYSTSLTAATSSSPAANASEILASLTDDSLAQSLGKLQCLKNEPVKLTHSGLTSIAFHPTTDTLVVAAGSASGELAIWNAGLPHSEGINTVHSFNLHAEDITGLRFLPADKSKLLSSSRDGKIRIFDLGSQSILTSANFSHRIRSLDVSDQKPHLAYFSTSTGDIGIHDTRTSVTNKYAGLFCVYPNKDNIWSLAVNPFTPHLIATASTNTSVELWDIRYIKALSKPRSVSSGRMMDSATSVQWNTKGNILACSSFGSHLQFFEASDLINSDLSPDSCITHIGHIEHKCPPHKPIYRLNAQFHPDSTIGFRVCSLTSNGNSINFYSSKTGKQIHQFNDLDFIEKTPTVMAYHPSATLSGKSNIGSAMVCGTAAGSAFILF